MEGGLIRIVGEEDEDHYSTDLEGEKSFDTAFSDCIMSYFENYKSPRPDVEPIQRDMFEQTESSRKELRTKRDEIVIFIDPMDGTREFVEGRIQNVQCLIGITLNGMPVAGAVGMPMVHENQIEIAYGLISPKKKDDDLSTAVPLLSGIKMFDAQNPLVVYHVHTEICAGNRVEEETLMVFSGDSKNTALKFAMNCLENGSEDFHKADSNEGHLHPPIRKIVTGGCGHKILSVQRHFQSLCERHNKNDSSGSSLPPTVGAMSIAPPGSSSWDTAAPTAVLLAADPQACVTDLFGHQLTYDGIHLLNDCGLVVSSGCIASRVHVRLCEELCKNQEFCEVIGVVLDDVAPVECVEVR